MSKPICGKCGKPMTPEDSRIHPEYFLHDACLPDELKSKTAPKSLQHSNPYQWVVVWMRGERWSQRQDSTTDQLIDVLPLINAMGCQDAGELIHRLIQQRQSNTVLDQLRAEVERWRSVGMAADEEIQQILGRALGYPWYHDDQKSFPGATEADGVCVGEHVAASLAMEAADRIQAYENKYGKLT